MKLFLVITMAEEDAVISKSGLNISRTVLSLLKCSGVALKNQKDFRQRLLFTSSPTHRI
jgi:hypothetical protein